ncbi:MAG: branched-chain amino acid ABC transporter permease [Candidatus Tectomicrobia bacterium]|nr:branched-chain amino acid ABC transporter permease [Candidatus Tectomicrobia bacterium]
MRDDLHSYLRRRHRVRLWELLPWLLAIGAFFVFPDYMAFATQVLITVIFALSLDLILGYAGVVTLGHAAYFGVGAYTAGMLSAHLHWTEPLSALIAAALCAGVIGVVSGFILMRYHGLTLLMLTLATAIMLHELANVYEDVTGGFDGLLGIEFEPLFGVFPYDLWGHTHYWYALSALLIMFVIARRIVYSPFGQSLVGIRENVQRMHAIGAPVYRRLVIIYAISAAMAGVAGGLFAQSNAFVTLDVLSFSRSGTILIMLILGGVGRLYGAFVGALVYMLLEDQLAKLSPEFWEFGVGLVLVLTVLFAREGLLGLFSRTDRVNS